MKLIKHISYIKHLTGFKHLSGVLIMCLFFHLGFGQKNRPINVSFDPIISGSNLLLRDTIYLFDKANTIKIETLKFYISYVQLFEDEKLVYTEKESYHLYDFSDSTHHSFNLKTPTTIKFNSIKFNLGIDSITNVSGAMGKDLDPTKGMYWTWQSGYINFKLEGTSNLCTNPKKEFQYHLGGYMKPFYCIQTVSLNASQKSTIHILLDLNQIIKAIDLSKQDHMMSPTAEAVKLSEVVSKCFSIKP